MQGNNQPQHTQTQAALTQPEAYAKSTSESAAHTAGEQLAKQQSWRGAMAHVYMAKHYLHTKQQQSPPEPYLRGGRAAKCTARMPVPTAGNTP